MATVYIGLGSNIAPEANLPAAAARLGALIRVRAASAVYRTPPWGEPDQPDFLNAVVAGETGLAPLALLEGLLAIEQALRRRRGKRWGPRSADLDLLMYDDLVLESERLTLPHPRLHERGFVLVPWCELAPQLVHPVLGKTLADLLRGVETAGIARVPLRLCGEGDPAAMAASPPAAASPPRPGRIGVLVPSSNTTVEPEFYRALPADVTLHTARLFLTRIEPDSIEKTAAELERASRYLATADVDVIVLGATAPSFLKGVGYDREVIGKIEAAGGRPATTTSTAMLEALTALGVRRVALGSAYTDEVNRIAAGFLEANGFEVVALEGLGYVDNLEVGRLDVETAYEAGCRVDRPEADAVLLACTNWQSMAIIERLERKLGKPVVTTTQASLWAALRFLGRGPEVTGYGHLFTHGE